jgi:phosphate transport system permease protein
MSNEVEDKNLKQLMHNDERRKKRKALVNKLFEGVLFLCTLFGVVMLVVLIMRVLIDGLGWMDWQYLTSLPSRFPEQAGIKPAFAGSVWIIVLVGLISFPLGVGTAIYLEEYADDDSWFLQS